MTIPGVIGDFLALLLPVIFCWSSKLILDIILKVNVVHLAWLVTPRRLPVGSLHHLSVPHAGGGEGGVDAGGAGALVAVRHETKSK